jgi:hypothetical protein
MRAAHAGFLPPTAALACSLMLGCGIGSGDPQPRRSAMSSPAHASPDEHHGALDGRVLRPPGRDPRSGTGTGTPVPVNGDPIQARDPTGRIIATTVTATGGTFHLLLRPGRYQITEGICGVSRPADIKAGTTTTLTIPIPC